MIRTSVMNQLEGRSIAFVNLFLFTIYFTYIIIGGVVFMWLEKPREEEVCAKLAEDYAKLNELQKASEMMQNRSQSLGIDVSDLPDDVSDLYNTLFAKKRRRKKRQEWWDEDYIANKIAEVKTKFNVDDYQIIKEVMTYEESIDKCQELGNYKLAVTTNFDELFFVTHHVAKGEKMKFWLQLRENGETPCDSKCWTYRLSSLNRFNYHVKDWRRHPNFRFLNCNKRTYALCKKTVPDCKKAHPCLDKSHNCPAQSMCVPTSKSDFKCVCPHGTWFDKKTNSCASFCPDGFGWGRPIGGEYGCFDIDECEEKVDQCGSDKPQCLNNRGHYVCKCLYHEQVLADGSVRCIKQRMSSTNKKCLAKVTWHFI